MFKDGKYNFLHGKERIEANSYLGKFFVRECKKNGRHFNTHSDATARIIQNYE